MVVVEDLDDFTDSRILKRPSLKGDKTIKDSSRKIENDLQSKDFKEPPMRQPTFVSAKLKPSAIHERLATQKIGTLTGLPTPGAVTPGGLTERNSADRSVKTANNESFKLKAD